MVRPRTSIKKGGFFSIYTTLISKPGLRLLYSLSFLHSLGRSVLLPIIPLFVLELLGEKGGVSTVSGVIFGLKAIAGAIASVWVGRLGDRIGHGKVVVIALLAMMILFPPQSFVTASWQLILLQLLTGVAGVGVVPGIGALLTLYSPKGLEGATFGLEGSIDAMARTIGPMIGSGIAVWLGAGSVFPVVGLFYAVAALMGASLYPVVAEKGAVSQKEH